MMWHIVRFDFTDVDDAVREEIEDALMALDDLDVVAWLRLSRDIDEDNVTGLITGFVTEEDLVTYRTHPDHLPVVRAIGALGIAVSSIDMHTDDDVAAMPN